jgi:spore maturation protein CgeB
MSHAGRSRPSAVRVFLLGYAAYPDSFEWHVADSLRHLGCEVHPFNRHGARSGPMGVFGRAAGKLVNSIVREPERLQEGRLLRELREFAPSLVMVLLGSQVSPKTVELIRKITRAPVVCWCQDQMTTLGRQYLLGAGYDAVFVKDRYMQDLFSRMIKSTKFHYLAEACNPRVHRPIPLTAADHAHYGCDVMLAGSIYYYRQEILQNLTRLDVKLWGFRPDWMVDRLPGQFKGRYVHGDDKVRATLAARICLNTLHYAEVDSLNCRAFEIAGCGGFQLVTSVAVVPEHFKADEEIVVFRNIEELTEKVRHYLQHPEAASAIAERGRLRAHRDHTYEHRLRDILTIAGQREP